MRRLLAVLALVLGLSGALAACAVGEEAGVGPDAVIIDVRTPAEYDEGHLEGAVNIDVSASDFDERMSQLDPDGEYFVYCRTGNRSAQAAERMEDLGFGDVTDLGSFGEAQEATGIPVVTG
ncbi:rhodanese-like domain-containing protein [Microbacterium sp. LRZ72]|uniref:rhodanese-like domain-containing protein n=1 Tax=Microbacterium sp. LRZ72 TaxID=2942481 RepID=UPI0029A7C8E0|nr:rhodanese-like domain-containing protein [Microbacterium sp. LRZ72]MDX2375854.1 rhodanese-like domain-containing protein [Microbacterium sp. LRZ72]